MNKERCSDRAHMMVLAEEEHLRRTLGESYQAYCYSVPRYIGLPRSNAKGASA